MTPPPTRSQTMVRCGSDGIDAFRSIKAKVEANTAAIIGATPLFMVSQNGHTEVVKLLLESGTDVNTNTQIGDNNYSPLSVAINGKYDKIIELL